MIYRKAHPNDIPALVHLINSAYRGESSRAGWTTEADLLSGRRIDETGVLCLLDDPDSHFLLVQSEESIVATIHAQCESDTVHFGLFAVEPSLQGCGIGKRLLTYAESEASTKWGIDIAIMEVITLRSELIDYYQRRGYCNTGEIIDFPQSELWDAQVKEITMAVLSKRLHSNL